MRYSTKVSVVLIVVVVVVVLVIIHCRVTTVQKSPVTIIIFMHQSQTMNAATIDQE